MRHVLSILGVVAGAFVLSAAQGAEAPKPESPKAKPVYRACPGELVWSEPANGCICPGALHWDTATKACSAACAPGKIQVAGAAPGVCAFLPRTCPAGKRWSELHDGCVVSCPAGKAANAPGTGCLPDPHNCPADTQWFDTRSACLPFCAPGRSLDYTTSTCVDDVAPPRPEPAKALPAPPPPSAAPPPSTAPPAPPAPSAAVSARPPPGRPPPKPVVKKTPTPCPEGKEWKDAFDGCVPICADDMVLDFYGVACHPIRVRR